MHCCTAETGFPGGTSGKEPTCQCRRHKRCGFDPWVWKNPLEEGMATHSSILAWRIPRTEEPGRLWSIGLQSQTRLKRLSTHSHDDQISGLPCFPSLLPSQCLSSSSRACDTHFLYEPLEPNSVSSQAPVGAWAGPQLPPQN